jgi:hypothetical protein
MPPMNAILNNIFQFDRLGTICWAISHKKNFMGLKPDSKRLVDWPSLWLHNRQVRVKWNRGPCWVTLWPWTSLAGTCLMCITMGRWAFTDDFFCPSLFVKVIKTINTSCACIKEQFFIWVVSSCRFWFGQKTFMHM